MLFKPCVQYLQNSTTKNSQKHDQLSLAMSDFCDSFNPYFQYLPLRWCMVCSKNIICGNRDQLCLHSPSDLVVQNIGVLW